MELLQLRYFLESATNENFSKTANKYMVPPSSVSLSVKKLEKELGCELFDRSGNKIQLNQKGRILKKALESSFEILDTAIEKLTSEAVKKIGDIYVLIRTERRVILDYMAKFKANHPDVIFHLSHDFSTEDTKRYDIIIDEQSDKYPDFKGTLLLSENMRVAASAQNPLSKRQLSLNDLKDEPFITMCDGSSLRRITVETCKKSGFNPNIIIESEDPYYLRKCIALNFGVAIIPEFSWKGQMEPNTVFLNIIDYNQMRNTYAYINKAKFISPVAKDFYNFLINSNSEVKSVE
ncbi:MAG: LysR family transcriptional regulator [Clostridia bacterium]|nr:LysR family transcriptional regulator [Clostridia bacterium]